MQIMEWENGDIIYWWNKYWRIFCIYFDLFSTRLFLIVGITKPLYRCPAPRPTSSPLKYKSCGRWWWITDNYTPVNNAGSNITRRIKSDADTAFFFGRSQAFLFTWSQSAVISGERNGEYILQGVKSQKWGSKFVPTCNISLSSPAIHPVFVRKRIQVLTRSPSSELKTL